MSKRIAEKKLVRLLKRAYNASILDAEFKTMKELNKRYKISIGLNIFFIIIIIGLIIIWQA